MFKPGVPDANCAHLCNADASSSGNSSSSSAEEGSSSDEDQQQKDNRRRRKGPAGTSSSRKRRRARRAPQVDYQQLHEQLFGFAAFDGDDGVFKEQDDDDYESGLDEEHSD